MARDEYLVGLSDNARDALIPLAHYLSDHKVHQFSFILYGGSFEWVLDEDYEENKVKPSDQADNK